MMMLSLTMIIPNFKADVVSVKYTGTENLFPDENCSLKLQYIYFILRKLIIDSIQ